MKQVGFSLLELVVAMAMAAILLALCLPGYQAQGEQLHRLAAEAKLLAWQVGGVKPVDGYYVYQQVVSASGVRWQATAVGFHGTCDVLSLVDEQKLPADCWPS